MFNISIAPVHVTDTILNLQIIVSAAAQPQGDFTAFIFIGNLAPGMGLPNVISFASCDAVQANQAGQALTVQVAGAVNSVTNPFTVSRVFDKNLWPGGNCPIGDSIARTR
jgi:hypothetical protein